MAVDTSAPARRSGRAKGNGSTRDVVDLEGRLDGFGFAPSTARIRATRRSRRWRVRRALRAIVVTLVATPLVFLVPPHIPWALVALAMGVVVARRRLAERYTLQSACMSCPRCRGVLGAECGLLREESARACAQCGLQLMLRVALP